MARYFLAFKVHLSYIEFLLGAKRAAEDALLKLSW